MATLTIRQLESRLRRAPHTVKEVYISIPKGLAGDEGIEFLLIKSVVLVGKGKQQYVVIDATPPNPEEARPE